MIKKASMITKEIKVFWIFVIVVGLTHAVPMKKNTSDKTEPIVQRVFNEIHHADLSVYIPSSMIDAGRMTEHRLRNIIGGDDSASDNVVRNWLPSLNHLGEKGGKKGQKGKNVVGLWGKRFINEDQDTNDSSGFIKKLYNSVKDSMAL